MNETRFWSMIDAAWPPTKHATRLRRLALAGELDKSNDLDPILEQMLLNLTSSLKLLNAEELLMFDRILEQKLYEIDRADIHQFVGGPDDGFLYRRGFIVGMGQFYYECISKNPAQLRVNTGFEEICYLPHDLYEEQYGPVPRSTISRESGSNARGWGK